MNDLTCRGSMLIGNGCGTCSKCLSELAEKGHLIKERRSKRMRETICNLADELVVDPVIDGQIDEYFSKRLPPNRKLGSIKELIAYKHFYESVGCLIAEGVEFMNKVELYNAIRQEWVDTTKSIKD